jgi:Glucodextranase, domain B
MSDMKKLAIFALFLITACSPTPTVVPLSAPASTNSPVPGMVASQVALPTAVIPTVMLQPTAAAASAPATSESLWLQVLSPLDNAVVNSPQVDVTGSAPAGTVISVNDEILIAGADQQFMTTVTLDEGPNLIEVIASDENGNETSVLVTVTYEP